MLNHDKKLHNVKLNLTFGLSDFWSGYMVWSHSRCRGGGTQCVIHSSFAGHIEWCSAVTLGYCLRVLQYGGSQWQCQSDYDQHGES